MKYSGLFSLLRCFFGSSSCSAFSILFTSPWQPLPLCSGVSSALTLAWHSLSCSLRLANLCSLCSDVCSGVSSALALNLHSPFLCCFCLIHRFDLLCWCHTNVTTSHQSRRLYAWRMHVRPSVHVPTARLQEITILITIVGLAQACPNYTYWQGPQCTFMSMQSPDF